MRGIINQTFIDLSRRAISPTQRVAVITRRSFRMTIENWELSIGQISCDPGQQTSVCPFAP
jgi:hypothetical protein